MKDRNHRSSALGRDVGIAYAKEILRKAGEHFGLDAGELKKLPRGDLRRAAIGWAIHRKSCIHLGSIAAQLNLGSAANASQQIRRFDGRKLSLLPEDVRAWNRQFT